MTNNMRTIADPRFNDIADDVIGNLPEGTTPITRQHGYVNITVRNCSKYERNARAYYLTGGTEITATTTKRYRHRSGLTLKSIRRLSPGYSDTRLRNAILRCVTETLGICYLHDARENAYKAVEGHIIPDADTEAACARFGNEGDYTTFDFCTCKAVIEWANQYPIKLSSM